MGCSASKQKVILFQQNNIPMIRITPPESNHNLSMTSISQGVDKGIIYSLYVHLVYLCPSLLVDFIKTVMFAHY